MRSLLLGIILGVTLTLACVALYDGRYEYMVVTVRADARDFVNSQDGWHVVPGQNDPTYLRRSRLPHP